MYSWLYEEPPRKKQEIPSLCTHKKNFQSPLVQLIVLSPPPHFDVRGSSGGSLSISGESQGAEYSVLGTSGRVC